MESFNWDHSNQWRVKLVYKTIYMTEQTCTICNDVFNDFLKHVLFDCNRNRAHIYRVKLYYFVSIEMQVGVRTLNLLKDSTDLQQSKYMLGYVDTNLIDVLQTDL